jgi:hypothetical protein
MLPAIPGGVLRDTRVEPERHMSCIAAMRKKITRRELQVMIRVRAKVALIS